MSTKPRQVKMEEIYGFCQKMQKPEFPTLGREDEIDTLCENLYKRRMKNCVLVGEPGVGKTEIVRRIAYMVRDDFVFTEMCMGALQAGTHYRGSFEERVLGSVRVAKAAEQESGKKPVVFIDEIHTICVAGSNDSETTGLTAANILKPFLASGEITIWGATTEREYNATIANDAALERRLPPVRIGEIRNAETVGKIVTNFSDGMLEPEQISEIVSAGNMLCQADKGAKAVWHQPDVSIEIADRVMARSRMRRRPPTCDDIADVVRRMRKA